MAAYVAASVALCFPGSVVGGTDTLPAVEILDLGDGVTMEFVLIRPGFFTMGSSGHDLDETPMRTVTITQPFYLGRHEVTQAQWAGIMGANPSHFRGERMPVDSVTWHDCQRFIAALATKTGRRFALPTEAQWEYACRAGTTSEYSFGGDAAGLDDHAWHAGNSGLATHPVGEKLPNPWGLHDMHGNVYEWCADWYSEGSYPVGDSVDPRGPRTGNRRVIRGGAWLFVPQNLRSADRGFSPPDYRSNEYGLRCVMPITGNVSPYRGDDAVREAGGETPGAVSLARTEALVREGDRLAAEFLLGQVESGPGAAAEAARLESLRRLAAALPQPPERLVVDLMPGVAMEFVLIRPGTFMRGSDASPLDNERPAHRVIISRPYYLGRYEVTQAQWGAVMGRNPSAFADAVPGETGELPVENVSWTLCQAFVAKLGELVPGRVFRLPTEAEWEYACRAGSSADRPGEGEVLDEYAWYGGNSASRTHPVGRKKPNPWGLHDMYGNVWEWCADRYGLYEPGTAWDPAGPAVSQFAGARVLRGGAWNNVATHLNSTFRHDAGPAIPMRYYGFRCAASVMQAKKETP